MFLFWMTIASYEADNTDKAFDQSVSSDIIDKANALKPAQLAAQGKLDEAIKEANAMLLKKKYDTLVNLCAGNVFMAAGLTEDGLKYLKYAVALSHRNRYVLEDYADKLAQVGRTDDAIGQYEALTKLDPTWLKPHTALAQLYMATDRPLDAADQLKFVCNANMKNFAARKLRAIALARGNQVKTGLEEYVLACAEEQQTGVPDALKSLLGTAGIKAADRVAYELQQKVDQNPEEYVPKLRLAQLYAYRNQPQAAKYLLLDARRQQPNNAEIQRTLAVVLKQLGEDTPAMSAFALSVKLEKQQQEQKRGEH
jgi:predicted Zn-dependent protease